MTSRTPPALAPRIDFDPWSEDFREFAALKWSRPGNLARALETLERLGVLASYGGGERVQCTVGRDGLTHTCINEWEVVAEARWALEEAAFTPADHAALITRSLLVLTRRLGRLADPEVLGRQGFEAGQWTAVSEAAAAVVPLAERAAEILAPAATPEILEPPPTWDFWSEHYRCPAVCPGHEGEDVHRCRQEQGHDGPHEWTCGRRAFRP